LFSFLFFLEYVDDGENIIANREEVNEAFNSDFNSDLEIDDDNVQELKNIQSQTQNVVQYKPAYTDKVYANMSARSRINVLEEKLHEEMKAKENFKRLYEETKRGPNRTQETPDKEVQNLKRRLSIQEQQNKTLEKSYDDLLVQHQEYELKQMSIDDLKSQLQGAKRETRDYQRKCESVEVEAQKN